MWIEITRSVIVAGEPVQAGSVIDAAPATAALLIGMNKARPAAEPSPPTEPSIEQVAQPKPQPTPEAAKRIRKPAPTPEADQ